MTYWKADGVAMPTPDTCSITEYDLDSAATGRPESGILYRERIRGNLGSYSMTFSRLSVSDAKKIRDAIMPAAFEVAVWFLGEYVTRTMYAGDRTYEEKLTEDGKEYVSMSFTLSEY